jgi:diacylglycerol kinase family enzyme
LEPRIASLNPAADRVLIVRNPHAGPGPADASIRELADCLRQHDLAAEVVGDLDAIGPLASECQAAGRLRAIVAAGGDGTVAEVVNRTPNGTPVTVFPLGTANLLAGYLGIDRDPLTMARMLSEGAIARLDAALANGRIFLIMASCGFDADVVSRLHERRFGQRINYWSWARPILASIRRYRFPRMRVYCDFASHLPDEPAQVARWVFIVNLPLYAAGLRVAPRALATDERLNVCTFCKGSFWRGLYYVANVALRRHERLPDFKAALASRVRIESDEPVPYQLDGDPGGFLPLEIEVMPRRLALVASRARLELLGFEPSAANLAGAQ